MFPEAKSCHGSGNRVTIWEIVTDLWIRFVYLGLYARNLYMILAIAT